MVAEDLGRQRYHQWVSSSCTMGLYLVWLEMICGHEHPSRSEPCHQDRQLQHPNPSRGHDVRAGRSWKHVPDWQVCSQNGSLTLSSSRFSFIQLMWYHDFIFLVAWRAIRQTSLTSEWSYLRLCLGRPLRPCMKWRYSFRTSIISLSLCHSFIDKCRLTFLPTSFGYPSIRNPFLWWELKFWTTFRSLCHSLFEPQIVM